MPYVPGCSTLLVHLISVNFKQPLTEEQRAKLIEQGNAKKEQLAKAREMRFNH